LFNTSRASGTVDSTLDSRVWAEGTGIDLQKIPPGNHDLAALDPVELLSRASRTENGFYVVHFDRATKQSVHVDGERYFQLIYVTL
jgi:hypothetical protein